jgi:hypothetical protein
MFQRARGHVRLATIPGRGGMGRVQGAGSFSRVRRVACVARTRILMEAMSSGSFNDDGTYYAKTTCIRSRSPLCRVRVDPTPKRRLDGPQRWSFARRHVDALPRGVASKLSRGSGGAGDCLREQSYSRWNYPAQKSHGNDAARCGTSGRNAPVRFPAVTARTHHGRPQWRARTRSCNGT